MNTLHALAQLLEESEVGTAPEARTEQTRADWLKVAEIASEFLCGWKPIESAPRDGTAILAKLPDSDCPVVINHGPKGWMVAWDNYNLGVSNAPTHWQALQPLGAGEPVVKWHETPDAWQLRVGDRCVATAYKSGYWHTWDRDGVGGENSRETDVKTAKIEAAASAIEQGFI